MSSSTGTNVKNALKKIRSDINAQLFDQALSDCQYLLDSENAILGPWSTYSQPIPSFNKELLLLAFNAILFKGLCLFSISKREQNKIKDLSLHGDEFTSYIKEADQCYQRASQLRPSIISSRQARLELIQYVLTTHLKQCNQMVTSTLNDYISPLSFGYYTTATRLLPLSLSQLELHTNWSIALSQTLFDLIHHLQSSSSGPHASQPNKLQILQIKLIQSLDESNSFLYLIKWLEKIIYHPDTESMLLWKCQSRLSIVLEIVIQAMIIRQSKEIKDNSNNHQYHPYQTRRSQPLKLTSINLIETQKILLGEDTIWWEGEPMDQVQNNQLKQLSMVEKGDGQYNRQMSSKTSFEFPQVPDLSENYFHSNPCTTPSAYSLLTKLEQLSKNQALNLNLPPSIRCFHQQQYLRTIGWRYEVGDDPIHKDELKRQQALEMNLSLNMIQNAYQQEKDDDSHVFSIDSCIEDPPNNLAWKKIISGHLRGYLRHFLQQDISERLLGKEESYTNTTRFDRGWKERTTSNQANIDHTHDRQSQVDQYSNVIGDEDRVKETKSHSPSNIDPLDNSSTIEFEQGTELYITRSFTNFSSPMANIILAYIKRYPWTHLALLLLYEMQIHEWIHKARSRETVKAYLLGLIHNLDSKQSPESETMTINYFGEQMDPNRLDLLILSYYILSVIYHFTNETMLCLNVCQNALDKIDLVNASNHSTMSLDQIQLYPFFWCQLQIIVAQNLWITKGRDYALPIYQLILEKYPDKYEALVAVAEMAYMKKDFVEALNIYNHLNQLYPKQAWPRARLAWIKTLPYQCDKISDQISGDNSNADQAREGESKLSTLLSITDPWASPYFQDQFHSQILDWSKKTEHEKVVRTGSTRRAKKDHIVDPSYSFFLSPNHYKLHLLTHDPIYRTSVENLAITKKSRLSLCIQARDLLLDLCQQYSSHRWFHYWLGRLHWIFEDYNAARDCWIISSEKVFPLATTCLGDFYLMKYSNLGLKHDLKRAKNCYISSLEQHSLLKEKKEFILEGFGNGTTILEASMPIVDMMMREAIPEVKNSLFLQLVLENDGDRHFSMASGDCASSINDHLTNPSSNKMNMDNNMEKDKKNNHCRHIFAIFDLMSRSGFLWANFSSSLLSIHLNDLSSAILHLQTYLTHHERNVSAWCKLIDCYSRQGKFHTALKVILRVQRFETANVQLLYWKARIHLKLGELIEALAVARQCVLTSLVQVQVSQYEKSRPKMIIQWWLIIAHLFGNLLLRNHAKAVHDGHIKQANNLLDEAASFSKYVIQPLLDNPTVGTSCQASILAQSWKLVGDIAIGHYLEIRQAPFQMDQLVAHMGSRSTSGAPSEENRPNCLGNIKDIFPHHHGDAQEKRVGPIPMEEMKRASMKPHAHDHDKGYQPLDNCIQGDNHHSQYTSNNKSVDDNQANVPWLTKSFISRIESMLESNIHFSSFPFPPHRLPSIMTNGESTNYALPFLYSFVPVWTKVRLQLHLSIQAYSHFIHFQPEYWNAHIDLAVASYITCKLYFHILEVLNATISDPSLISNHANPSATNQILDHHHHQMKKNVIPDWCSKSSCWSLLFQHIDTSISSIKNALDTIYTSDKLEKIYISINIYLRVKLWNMLAKASAFYLDLLECAKSNNQTLPPLKHIPTISDVNHYFIQAIQFGSQMDSSRSSIPLKTSDQAQPSTNSSSSSVNMEEHVDQDSESSNHHQISSSFSSPILSSEHAKAWNQASLFWLIHGTPIQFIHQTIKKALELDPIQPLSWALMCIITRSNPSSQRFNLGHNTEDHVIGKDTKSLSSSDTSTVPQYPFVQYLLGLVQALETSDSIHANLAFNQCFIGNDQALFLATIWSLLDCSTSICRLLWPHLAMLLERFVSIYPRHALAHHLLGVLNTQIYILSSKEDSSSTLVDQKINEQKKVLTLVNDQFDHTFHSRLATILFHFSPRPYWQLLASRKNFNFQYPNPNSQIPVWQAATLHCAWSILNTTNNINQDHLAVLSSLVRLSLDENNQIQHESLLMQSHPIIPMTWIQCLILCHKKNSDINGENSWLKQDSQSLLDILKLLINQLDASNNPSFVALSNLLLQGYSPNITFQLDNQLGMFKPISRSHDDEQRKDDMVMDYDHRDGVSPFNSHSDLKDPFLVDAVKSLIQHLLHLWVLNLISRDIQSDLSHHHLHTILVSQLKFRKIQSHRDAKALDSYQICTLLWEECTNWLQDSMAIVQTFSMEESHSNLFTSKYWIQILLHCTMKCISIGIILAQNIRSLAEQAISILLGRSDGEKKLGSSSDKHLEEMVLVVTRNLIQSHIDAIDHDRSTFSSIELYTRYIASLYLLLAQHYWCCEGNFSKVSNVLSLAQYAIHSGGKRSMMISSGCSDPKSTAISNSSKSLPCLVATLDLFCTNKILQIKIQWMRIILASETGQLRLLDTLLLEGASSIDDGAQLISADDTIELDILSTFSIFDHLPLNPQLANLAMLACWYYEGEPSWTYRQKKKHIENETIKIQYDFWLSRHLSTDSISPTVPSTTVISSIDLKSSSNELDTKTSEIISATDDKLIQNTFDDEEGELINAMDQVNIGTSSSSAIMPFVQYLPEPLAYAWIYSQRQIMLSPWDFSSWINLLTVSSTCVQSTITMFDGKDFDINHPQHEAKKDLSKLRIEFHHQLLGVVFIIQQFVQSHIDYHKTLTGFNSLAFQQDQDGQKNRLPISPRHPIQSHQLYSSIHLALFSLLSLSEYHLQSFTLDLSQLESEEQSLYTNHYQVVFRIFNHFWIIFSWCIERQSHKGQIQVPSGQLILIYTKFLQQSLKFICICTNQRLCSLFQEEKLKPPGLVDPIQRNQKIISSILKCFKNAFHTMENILKHSARRPTIIELSSISLYDHELASIISPLRKGSPASPNSSSMKPIKLLLKEDLKYYRALIASSYLDLHLMLATLLNVHLLRKSSKLVLGRAEMMQSSNWLSKKWTGDEQKDEIQTTSNVISLNGSLVLNRPNLVLYGTEHVAKIYLTHHYLKLGMKKVAERLWKGTSACQDENKGTINQTFYSKTSSSNEQNSQLMMDLVDPSLAKKPSNHPNLRQPLIVRFLLSLFHMEYANQVNTYSDLDLQLALERPEWYYIQQYILKNQQECRSPLDN